MGRGGKNLDAGAQGYEKRFGRRKEQAAKEVRRSHGGDRESQLCQGPGSGQFPEPIKVGFLLEINLDTWMDGWMDGWMDDLIRLDRYRQMTDRQTDKTVGFCAGC